MDDPPTETEAEPAAADGLVPLDPAQRHVLRIKSAITLGIVVAGLAVVDGIAAEARLIGRGSILIPAAVVALWTILAVPQRIWSHWGYRVAEDRLQVVHGNLFHVDTVVPFSRVQHIDVTAGPLARSFGLATLMLHTAGNHNSVVVLPGLAHADADALRTRIRAALAGPSAAAG